MVKSKKGADTKSARARKLGTKKTKSGKLIPMLFGIGLLLFLISGIIFYTQVYTKPSNVFLDMIDNNLITKGITRAVIQNDGETDSTEIAQFNYGTPTSVKLTRTLTGVNDQGNLTKLEGLGLGDSDFQRYIKAERTNDAATQQSFEKVLNQWVITGSNDESKGVAKPSILLRSLLGPVLFGNIPATTRQAIVDEIMASNVYEVDYKDVKKEKENGRMVYKFNTTVNLKKLITIMKKYASVTGIPGAESLDPGSYQESDKVQVLLSVDLRSRQLRNIEYAGSNVKETYSGYGVTTEMEAPKDYLSSEQFKQLLGQ